MSDVHLLTLDDFPVQQKVMTRWGDNDMFGHLNNAVYYELFDSAINAWFAEHTVIDPVTDPTQGIVAESGCQFISEVAFPTPLVVGLRLTRIGTSSAVIQLGLFVDPEVAEVGDAGPKAIGHWVHVEIDADTRRPTPLPEHIRRIMETGLVSPEGEAEPSLSPDAPRAR